MTVNPFHGLTDEERLRLLSQIGKDARKQFEEACDKSSQLAEAVNPLQLLAHFSFYDQLISSPEHAEQYEPVSQPSVEWLQAMILRSALPKVEETLNTSPTPEVILEINKCLNMAEQAFMHMRLPEDRQPQAIEAAAEAIRSHTAFTRNEGRTSQLRRLHLEIFRPLDDAFRKREGFSLTDCADGLWKLVDAIEKRINQNLQVRQRIIRHSKPRAIIKAFAEYCNADPKAIAAEMSAYSSDRSSVRSAVWNWFDTDNFRFFFFRPEELRGLPLNETSADALISALERISHKFGDLKDTDPEKLFLDNPIWKRPLIALGEGRYYFPIPGVVQSFGIEILEELLSKHGDLRDRYLQKVRPTYLEANAEAMLRRFYPGARIWRGLKWKHLDGTTYENDLLVIIDSHALVLECKAGRLRSRALRGDPAALEAEIRKLIQEPSLQGQRFREFIASKRGIVHLVDSTGVTQEIDLRRILRTTLINITLDYLGWVGVNSQLLKSAGLLPQSAPLATTIPLHDVENILSVLDDHAASFHYLHRRGEISEHAYPLAGEDGMLELYLTSGFDFTGVADESNGQIHLLATGEPIKKYFLGLEKGSPIPKPGRRFVRWWVDMLAQFRQRGFPGWIEAAYILLCVSYEQQKAFEQSCNRVTKDTRLNWHGKHENHTIMLLSEPATKFAIAYIAVKNKPASEVRRLVTHLTRTLTSNHGADRILVITGSAADKVYPYLGAYFHSSELQALGKGWATELQ